MKAQAKDRKLARWILDQKMGIPGRITSDEQWDALEAAARTLRRAQLTLHRWAEEECNGTIQRVDNGEGYPVRHYGNGNEPRLTSRIPDREAGALRRVAKVCKDAGLHYYHQTDPRGCSLFVSAEPLNDQNYSSRGIACL